MDEPSCDCNGWGCLYCGVPCRTKPTLVRRQCKPRRRRKPAIYWMEPPEGLKACHACGVLGCVFCPDCRISMRKKPTTRRYRDRREVPLPPEPTQYRPGSPEKVEVLCWRQNNHYALFHPDDAPPDYSELTNQDNLEEVVDDME